MDQLTRSGGYREAFADTSSRLASPGEDRCAGCCTVSGADEARNSGELSSRSTSSSAPANARDRALPGSVLHRQSIRMTHNPKAACIEVAVCAAPRRGRPSRSSAVASSE